MKPRQRLPLFKQICKNAEKQLTTVHNQMERLESELMQQVAELEKESAEQQQHIQTLHNQLAEEKGKLEKKEILQEWKSK
ncbi:Uncharacterised protein [Enterococcus faecalis]|nr:Uncharacterised protein [Enterococcus faecalis]